MIGNHGTERGGCPRDGIRVFAAGAGMGVDSGLPDFRGDEGFWKAYPPFAKLGLGFIDLASPRWFRGGPAPRVGILWPSIGALSGDPSASQGFAVMRALAENRGPRSSSRRTSMGNSSARDFDEDRVFECHGSIHHLQCQGECGYFEEATGLYVPDDRPRDDARARPACRGARPAGTSRVPALACSLATTLGMIGDRTRRRSDSSAS